MKTTIKRVPSMLIAATVAMLEAVRCSGQVKELALISPGNWTPDYLSSRDAVVPVQHRNFGPRNQRKIRKDRRRAHAAGVRKAFQH